MEMLYKVSGNNAEDLKFIMYGTNEINQIKKIEGCRMNNKLFKIIDHHEFFSDEIVNASKLINYANEVREEINNHLFEDEKEWPLVTTIEDAIYTMEHDNYEVQEIKVN